MLNSASSNSKHSAQKCNDFKEKKNYHRRKRKYLSMQLCSIEQITRKQSKGQRVARLACANSIVNFLLTYTQTMLAPPSE